MATLTRVSQSRHSTSGAALLHDKWSMRARLWEGAREPNLSLTLAHKLCGWVHGDELVNKCWELQVFIQQATRCAYWESPICVVSWSDCERKYSGNCLSIWWSSQSCCCRFVVGLIRVFTEIEVAQVLLVDVVANRNFSFVKLVVFLEVA